MLILTQKDIKKIFSMKDAIAASKDALCLYSDGKAVVPLRVNIDIQKQQGRSLFMPAYIDELNALGIKIVSVFPKNSALGKSSVPAQMILMDGTTGEVCALIDGTYLTQLRTGALQGAATDILARKNAKTAVLFGTGGQARTQIEAMLSVRSLEEISVFGVDLAKAQRFVAEMQKEFTNTRLIAGEDVTTVVKHADIITTITSSKKPVFDGTLLKQGAHVNGIGSYMSDMQELPDSLIQKADKIIFDTSEGVLEEAGDILIPMKAGLVSQQDFDGELGEIISGRIKGRETDQEITVFKAVGSAVFDVLTALRIYQKALEENVGQRIEM